MADSAQWATVVFRWADDTRVDLLLCGQEPADLAVVEGLAGSSWRPGEAGGPCTSTRSPRSWRSCSSWLAYAGRWAGRPNAANSASASRKECRPEIRSPEISITWSANGL